MAPADGSLVHQLDVARIFATLPSQDKLYAHHMSRAAWHGARVDLRQVSQEAEGIFDFIIELYQQFDGEWDRLRDDAGLSPKELEMFLEYAALFLCNIGNYYGEGNQKFVPEVSREVMQRLAKAAGPKAEDLLRVVVDKMWTVPPYSLGLPSETAQSSYYPGEAKLTRGEIDLVSKAMEQSSIEPENTRLRKIMVNGEAHFEVLIASADVDDESAAEVANDFGHKITLRRGDFADALSEVCRELRSAWSHAANETQRRYIECLIKSFTHGGMDAFREAQKYWVKDMAPRIENMMGFIETYRDPAGIRAEWFSAVGISDQEETAQLQQLVGRSTAFISRLPWAAKDVNDGKGPFEKTTFVAPDFTVVHGLTVCQCYVFEATNLPNYNDIRETCGFKNIVIANRMSANNNPANPCHYIHNNAKDDFRRTMHIIRFVTTAVHEVLGHGTGKLFSETAPGECNFDIQNPPFNPLTGRPVETWYRPGQTWTGVFQDVATTIEECRATLVSHYSMDDKELLAIFGYSDASSPTADELIYNSYLHIGVEGLKALEHYDDQNHTWGEAHKRGHFAVFKQLLLHGGGCLSIHMNEAGSDLTIKVDRSKILSRGKPALGQLLRQLHIWRCTADVVPSRQLYEPLTAVDGEYSKWREIVCSKPEPRWKFVQVNTFLNPSHPDGVELKEYEATNAGIIKSWAERRV